MKVIVVGNGGREHTIAWKIAQSAKVETVFCVPGNGGTANESKCVNIDVKNLVRILFQKSVLSRAYSLKRSGARLVYEIYSAETFIFGNLF